MKHLDHLTQPTTGRDALKDVLGNCKGDCKEKPCTCQSNTHQRFIPEGSKVYKTPEDFRDAELPA